MNAIAKKLWRFAQLAEPYRKKFMLIGLLAALATASELVEPLIYRAAINDVSGVFVHRAAEEQHKNQLNEDRPPQHPTIGLLVSPTVARKAP